MNLEASSENSYNNADSFAMAFDAAWKDGDLGNNKNCLLYTSPSPRDQRGSRMPSSA